MTSTTISTEEGKTDKASNDDPVETRQQKPNDGTKKAEEGLNSSFVESVEGNNISEEAGESEATGEMSIAEKLTDGMETKEQVPKVTAKETSSGSDLLVSYKLSNKKNKNQSSPSKAIKTPDVHDVLLGRGKPVSQLFLVVAAQCHQERTPNPSNSLMLFHDLVSKPRWKSKHA
jgi:hypothetical protein